ncbi:TniB family NTP-binding protein [Leptolyngbya sp. PCC 6406]|uniref:TniB family NTP-binding protein n=1 Tax=Leptolyngbya sp. PCC 6406 TaxID=1173264 RepID=UPI0002ACB550|nr:ATP-binding protein [Leptolyngbya sp. PCC 6406]
MDSLGNALMSPPPPTPCPFVAGPMIQSPQSFVGRADELQTLINRMAGTSQPTSVNVVGERRIGKSSLLYHFYQTWPQRLPPEHRHAYAVIYLSLQGAPCTEERSLYQAIARTLLDSHPHYPEEWRAIWRERRLDRPDFGAAVRQSRAAGVLPVLCLDEFEALFAHRAVFQDDFYDSLRTLMNNSDLMLITASRRLLDEYRRDYQLTSAFFNLGQVSRLECFSDPEARQVVTLPDPAHPALSPAAQETALQWGRKHPLLLQMAALALWEAAQLDKPETWAQQRFALEAQRLQRELRQPRYWPRWCQWLVFGLPRVLGNCLSRGFNGLERILKLGPGAMVPLIVLLLAMGIITQSQWAWLRNVIREILETFGMGN